MDARTRLLVVDDDASVRSLLREYLEGHGFVVVEAATGTQMRERIDTESRRMFELGGAEVTITAMEYDLVTAFLANSNRVLSRDQLLLCTRNREWEPFDRSIDIRVGRLRRKVEPDPSGEPRCIRTVRNAGYMFVPNTS